MFIEISKGIVLGIVEGVTEFLPISSTGHLILINEWIRFSGPFTAMFDIVIQLGAVLAVIAYFWKTLWPFSADSAHVRSASILWMKAVIGVLPVIVLGLLFGQTIEEKLFNPLTVASALLAGGIILILIENRPLPVRFNAVVDIPYATAFGIGVVQGLSMIPGTSRAAATIIGAMLLGVSRKAAVEFSLFLAIPTMVAASGYSLLVHKTVLTSDQLIVLLVGFIVAFVTALAVIRLFVGFIEHRDFKPFGYYRIVLGLLVIAFVVL
ncbi:undecaprenyl-diphosphatase [Candidatus Kaiserbacteria bacterium RIFCSPLOWO2_12_FULL_52_8]|uniref:Undecaprenyl-diphosphatase n=1 Tax=Candidatus Kaiserbacteria bacterium RIFCSPHIGHO2_01_FULL_53_31 TaxID=1798481 RepID=A0A1F6CHD2_9BACT|nr:MAG: undecaprenyl-diphosphatase [Candidatus Kaiserbacteria bacterium RIFCSPHIGHO2_01_FULL_53_31]OGG92819.1 MAG: undecaprenyl-diphosphatase [Candidatus Kaiserbacteria bacterium RIFCSPLOWO2_12_FULL_52_8]